MNAGPYKVDLTGKVRAMDVSIDVIVLRGCVWVGHGYTLHVSPIPP